MVDLLIHDMGPQPANQAWPRFERYHVYFNREGFRAVTGFVERPSGATVAKLMEHWEPAYRRFKRYEKDAINGK